MLLTRASRTLTRRLVPLWFLSLKVCYISIKNRLFIHGLVGEYEMEDQTTPAPPIYLTKGDVAITSEGTVLKCSSPSKTRGGYTITRSDFLNNLSAKYSIWCYLHRRKYRHSGRPQSLRSKFQWLCNSSTWIDWLGIVPRFWIKCTIEYVESAEWILFSCSTILDSNLACITLNQW